MAISGSGLVSGLDTKSMIQQLVMLERQPIVRLQARKTSVNAEISSLGTLSSKMSELTSLMTKMKDLSQALAASAESNKEDVVTALASADAVMTTYDISVFSLAESARDRSKQYIGGSSSIVDAGTIEITVFDEDPVEIIVDPGMTLNDVRDAINDSDADVVATVMNRSDGSAYLHITSNKTGFIPADGAASALVIDEGTTDLGLNRVRDAQNAVVMVDGLPAAPRQSNTIDDIIDGVTFNLHDVSPFIDGGPQRETHQITVGPDNEKMIEQLESFVNQYNDIMKELDKETFSRGSIGRSARMDMQQLIASQVGDDVMYNSLASIGIKTNHNNGQLELDKSKLEAAINDDAYAVANVFAAETTGLAEQMETVLKNYTDKFDGRIKLSQDSLQSMIKSLDSQIDRQNLRIERYEASLRRRFANLEVMLSELSDVGNRFAASMPRY